MIDFNKFEEDIMIDSDYSQPSMGFTRDKYFGYLQVYCTGELLYGEYQGKNP